MTGDATVLPISRKTNLILALPFLFYCMAVLTPIAAQQRFQRVSIDTFMQDPAKVRALREGVAKMKARNDAPKDSADYRTSWEYWAAIHGYFGTGPKSSGTIQRWKTNPRNGIPPSLWPRFDGIRELTPPSSPPGLAEKVWGTCEHGTDAFFPWHRAYLYFFERVLRKASGDANFALPYWDYTSADAAKRILPAIFRDAENGANPLFDARRATGVSSNPLSAIRTNPDGLLREANFISYQEQLESGLHGNIHCDVATRCPVAILGAVPVAALDPVFWLHHANIDRLWDCWAKKFGTASYPAPGSAWRRQTYSFVDENGNPATMSVAQMLDPAGPVDYTYDNTTACTRQPQPPVAVAMNERTRGLRAGTVVTRQTPVAENVQLRKLREPVDVRLNDFGREPRERARGLRVSPSEEAEVTLKLEGVTFASVPPAGIDVFLTSTDGTKRVAVGSLSFFAGDTSEHASHRGAGNQAETGKTFAFNVTEALTELAAGRDTLDTLKVEFEPAPAFESDPAVDETEYASAQVKIGKISFTETTQE